MHKHKLNRVDKLARKLVKRRDGQLYIAGVLIWNISTKADRDALFVRLLQACAG